MSALDTEDDHYRQYSIFYLMEGLLLDSESIHGVTTSISYQKHSATPYQIYKMGPLIPFNLFLPAVTKAVKLITNMNDVAVSIYYAVFGAVGGTNSTSAFYYIIGVRVRLLESKSVIALTRLNNISDKIFASNVSVFLGFPVTMRTSEKWATPNETDYSSYFNFNLGMPENDGASLITSKYKPMLFTLALSIINPSMVVESAVFYSKLHYLTHHT